ncbi:hypothetical protein RFI_18804 [Reticulomyxa filosa]|uniref:Uncharacterized protein n=1 Tax=Reticulomyxa filosa TaxID=46433 RepID=X6MYB5_RETFI|nr:hypothetical protein RFI_18804 [Reticulomyxa filosa]|eukprot:ETO18462.1 hypothetical protein RFI_18804 [Reticulomyxa filosa]
MSSAKSNNEDREVAWEALETARLLCGQCLEDQQFIKDAEAQKRAVQTLLEVFSLLGELQMENGQFAEGIREFERAIDCFRKYGLKEARHLAFFHFMCVTSAENAHLPDVYETHLKATITLLCERLDEILNTLGRSPSEKDSEKILEAVSKVLADEKVKAKTEPAVFEEIEELQAVLNEVLSKETKLPDEDDEDDEDEENEENEENEEDEEEEEQEEGANTEKKEELGSPKKKAVEGKKNNQQESNLLAKQTQEKLAQDKAEERHCRKRTYGEADIFEETGEPKTKKLRGLFLHISLNEVKSSFDHIKLIVFNE